MAAQMDLHEQEQEELWYPPPQPEASAATWYPPAAPTTSAAPPPTIPATAPSINSFSDPALFWRHEPGAAGLEGSHILDDEGQLRLSPAAQRDYWSKTYYAPLLIKHDGQALLASVAPSAEATLELGFTLCPRAQFDQAGALIRVSDATWVKAGIEFVDGVPVSEPETSDPSVPTGLRVS